MESIKPPIPSDIQTIREKYPHFLKEFRKRFFFTFYFFIAATLIGFIFYEQIIGFLVILLSLEGINIVFTSPFQFVNLSISCGIAVGLIVIFPIIIGQIMSFLKPALKRKEFKVVLRFIPFNTALFLTGFTFGALIMKWQIEIFITKSLDLGIGNVLDISKLLSTILLTSSLMGVGFQFPIVLLLLVRLNVIKRKTLSSKRLWVYLISFMFAMLLPADSIFIDLVLSLPFIILFEITLILARFVEKKEK
ncbi:twin-arginine translocase subunit TatC [Candidatus Microgenomates bacterium]|nr:twin-arginine translocase subunit TatC [Candidatus Microgenomates bacterium]